MTLHRSRRAVAALGAMTLILSIGAGTVAAAGPNGGGRGAGAASGTAAGGAQAGGARARAGARATGPGGSARAFPVGTLPAGTLTADQSAALASMAEEEKLAQDLYGAFAARYPSVAWDNIGAAESTHLAAVRSLLARYGIADPTAGLAAGSFASTDIGALYDSLLARGSASEAEAFEVGRLVELDDIEELDAALAGVTAPDVLRVYANLRRGSTQHLAAFTRLLA